MNLAKQNKNKKRSLEQLLENNQTVIMSLEEARKTQKEDLMKI